MILEAEEGISGALEKLGALDKVKKVRDLGGKEGWNSYEIMVDMGTDARERIARLCRAENWNFRSLHRSDATLEDVFVELTRKD